MDSPTNANENGDHCNKELLLKDIGTMNEKDLYQYGKLLGIKNFQDSLDLKEKITLNVMRKTEVNTDKNSYTEDSNEKHEVTFKEEELRQQCMNNLLTETELVYYNFKKEAKIKTISSEGFIEERDDPLITKINNEFVDIEMQFRKKTELVSKTPSCALLICGDSYAGKSSFINLLINEPLLRIPIKRSTACQIRWTYGERERLELVHLEGKVVTILKNDFSRNLHDSTEKVENETQLIWQSATIFLNCPVLKSGLDIYEELTDDLEDIAGVFLLLKRNEKIEDNTLAQLSKIVNHIVKNGLIGVSVHLIINMCNLSEDAKKEEKLKANITKQIQDKLKFFCPKIIVFNEERDPSLKDTQCISMNVEDILMLIQNIHLNSVNTITISIFEFLVLFVQKAIAYISETEQFVAADIASKKNYIKKFERLESESKLLNQLFKKQNECLLKDQYQKYKKEVENHLLHSNSEATKVRVVSEVIRREDLLFGMTDIMKIDKEIMTLTHEAILKNIKEQNILRDVCHEMLTTFLHQFVAHQKKKYSITKEMQSDINSSLNYNKGDLTTLCFNDLMRLPTLHMEVIQIFTPIIVPEIKFINTIKKNGRLSLFSFIPKLNVSAVETFYEDTRLYVRNRSSSNYDKYTSGKDNIKMIMDSLFENPQQVAKDFVNYLVDDMEYLGQNIDQLKNDLRSTEKVLQTYKGIKESLERIYNELCKINMLYLTNEFDDITKEKIKIPTFPRRHSNNKSAAILFNRNRLLHCGHFKGTPMKDSAVLVFKNVDGKHWKDLYQEYENHKEISKCFLDKDILDKLNCFITIRFHILSRINDPQDLNPMFFVNGVDHSLRTYFKEYRSSIETRKDRDKLLNSEIKRVLRQILNGLSYLHNRKLVHYDLTMDAIGYDSTYATVKLSSISLETSVKIDHSSTSRNYVHEIAHLPREILDKDSQEKYTSKSDMYCLGIILYQLWVDIHPFFDTIENKEIDTVEQFVELLQASKFNKIVLCSLFHGGFAQMVYTWATLCWENKHTAHEFYNSIEKPMYYGSISN